MKNLFKTLTLVSLLCAVASSFAAPNSAKDRDFRQQKTALKDTATADNELPAALQEILLDSKPLDNTASDQTTSDNLYFSKMQNDGNLQNPQLLTQDNEIKPYASKITLTNMGSPKGIEIYPGQKSAGISFTLPIDKVITSARLDLYVSMTEAMQGNTNHIDVKVNGQALGSLPVAKT